MAVSVIPAAIQGQRYISLTTFRKNGAAVATPVWFGEGDDKLYIMTRSIFGKYKRIRNNPGVWVAPPTIGRGLMGPAPRAFPGILPFEKPPPRGNMIKRNFWLARLPL